VDGEVSAIEWLFSLAGLAVGLLLLAPPLVLAGLFFTLVGIGLFGPMGRQVSHLGFDCPFSKRKARVELLGVQGDEQPADVLACSVFSDPHRVTCEKRCLGLAQVRTAAVPLMPRFSLLADGVAYRAEAKQA
jgi:hypothetical protein